MRINQFVAAASSLSRRAADEAIAQGRVKINGQIGSLGASVPDNAEVELDGKPLRARQNFHYILLHKPAGYVSSHSRQGQDPTIYQLLPPKYARMRLAGRLDRDSTGLLLLSNDGEFVYRYTHPSQNKQKTYELSLVQALDAADIRRLEAGVQLKDGLSRVKVLAYKSKHITVSLAEGRNRQLRRTFGALGYAIVSLHRTAIGSYHIGNLHPGAWREVQAN